MQRQRGVATDPKGYDWRTCGERWRGTLSLKTRRRGTFRAAANRRRRKRPLSQRRCEALRKAATLARFGADAFAVPARDGNDFCLVHDPERDVQRELRAKTTIASACARTGQREIRTPITCSPRPLTRSSRMESCWKEDASERCSSARCRGRDERRRYCDAGRGQIEVDDLDVGVLAASSRTTPATCVARTAACLAPKFAGRCNSIEKTPSVRRWYRDSATRAVSSSRRLAVSPSRRHARAQSTSRSSARAFVIARARWSAARAKPSPRAASS